MATVTLQAVGFAIGGPIGGMIGAVIGGMIDQKLFGPGDQEGPRLTDLKVTTSTYGTAIPLVYGPENRLAGNIIWSTDLIETADDVSGGKGGGPSITEFTYTVSCAIAISGRELQFNGLSRIWANNKVIYDGMPSVSPTDINHPTIGAVRFYPGSATQTPDPLIESFKGIGNTPAFRHTSYVVLEDLQLADFGNRLPNFEFEVIADETIAVNEVLNDMTARAGISNASVFGIEDLLQGYTVGRQVPVHRAVLPLAIAYDFETTEQRGQIRFIKKAKGMKASVPLESMNAHVPSVQPSDKSPINYKNISEVSMPDEVTISFRDQDMDYQVNTQAAARRKGNAINKITQELPLVLTSTQARRIAERLLWGAWSNKKGSTFTLSDTWVRINSGDLLGIPTFDETLPMKVITTTRGNNGLIEMEAGYEDPEIYNSQVIGIDGLSSSKTVSIPGITLFVPMDAPLLHDTDPASGFYWGATGQNDGWRGATIKRSVDSGVTYDKVTDVAVRNPIGTITGTLATGPTEVFDRINTLRVTLTSGKSSLESVSELLVLNGYNSAWVGPAVGGVGEIIQFTTATLVSSNTYDLSDLLRGRLGSEHAVDGHSTGEVFVLLQKGSLGTSEFGINDWDKERQYKPVSILTTEATTTAQAFTNTGVRSKPLSPDQVKCIKDGSNNLTITWLRRTRVRVPGLGRGEAPLGETTEAYEVDILDGATVVRTIEVTSETASYSAAEQTTDGLTPGDLVTIDIYQLSETRGRGYARRAIL